MTYTCSGNTIVSDYMIGCHSPEKTSLFKDLGVTLDTSLQFSHHLDNVINKAFQMLGFIKRCTQDFTSTIALKTLYCALVRPHLEYASCVWSPFYGVHIDALQRVEHKFLKQIAYKLNILDNYTDANILNMLNMAPITARHKRRDLITFYNILHGKSGASELLQKINIRVPLRTTRATDSFHQPIHRTNYGLNNFLTRTIRLANQQHDIDLFESYSKFLSQVLLNIR